jgi:hypothetical protein
VLEAMLLCASAPPVDGDSALASAGQLAGCAKNRDGSDRFRPDRDDPVKPQPEQVERHDVAVDGYRGDHGAGTGDSQRSGCGGG